MSHAFYSSSSNMEHNQDDSDSKCHPLVSEDAISGRDIPNDSLSKSSHVAMATVATEEGRDVLEMLLRCRTADSKKSPTVSKAGNGASTTSTVVSKHALHQQLNLDNHPAMTRLQNEQNSRLENMEQRMKKIRQSAQQELERRKFATLFRARSEESSHTEKLLHEASEALQLFKKQKQMKKPKYNIFASHALSTETSLLYGGVMRGDSQEKEESDSGEIIPVRIVSDKSLICEQTVNKKPASVAEEKKASWVLQPLEAFNISGPVMWLLLPFLLPVLLLLHLIRHFCHHGDPHTRKKN